MRLRIATLLVAVVLASGVAAAAGKYGAHSTPGIRLFMANLPGSIIVVWVGLLIGKGLMLYGGGLMFYVLCSLANWAFYFYVIKAALLLKRKIWR